MLIKVNDTVKIIAGDDRGATGRVLTVDREKNKIIVEGINKVYKHVRRSQRNPQGGRLSKEMPVSVSNVMILCPQTNQPTRIGVRFLEDGSKERFAKCSGASLGAIAPARAAHAPAHAKS